MVVDSTSFVLTAGFSSDLQEGKFIISYYHTWYVSPATTGDGSGGDDMVVVVEDNCTMLPPGDMVVVEDISSTIVIPAGRDKLDVLRDIPIPRKGRAAGSGYCVAGTSELLHSSVPWRLV